MATRASKRITKEMNEILFSSQKDNDILYYIDPDDMFEWYFLIHKIPINKQLDDCYFIGKMIFTKDYPFEAPVIRMLTPTGIVITEKNICVSGLSSYHSNTWSPLNTGKTIAMAFLSVMLESSTTGIGWTPIHKSDKIIENLLVENCKTSKGYNRLHYKSIQDIFLQILDK
jgi:ubiquitin-conjugating enzyme E2 J1